MKKVEVSSNFVVPKKSRPTIMQIAKEAGVSISTVSHAFSGRRPISPEIKDHIFQVANRHGYRPHYAAQILASRRTMTLGILVREPTDQFFSIHLKGINQAATERGYRLTLGITGKDEKKMQEYLSGFCHGQVDGILILTGLIPDEMVIEAINQGMPICTPQRTIPHYEEYCGVQMDIRGIFRRLLDYLYDLGHRQFGFICGTPKDVPERHPEFHRFIEEKNLSFTSQDEVVELETSEDSEIAAAQILRRNPEITALVCTNDVLAVGALATTHEMGIPVPQKVSITGYDDVPIGRYCYPKLTTIRIPIAELAAASVNHLIDRIEGKTPKIVKLTPELIIRGSSGPPH
jgi:LacI family transcriptional regulator